MDKLRRALGEVGVWSMELKRAHRPQVREAAAELDDLGFRGLWIPGLDGKAALDDVGHLLAAAPHTTVALGILAIWGQDPGALGVRLHQLDIDHGPRTWLGLGISNADAAVGAGQTYGSPTQSMNGYLDALDAATHPVSAARRFLGALGPRMVDLAVDRTAGWHPFLVTPDYIARERVRVGSGPVIATHQAVVLERDPQRARAVARAGIGMFLGFPAYRNNLIRLGFDSEDLIPGGSDRLIDALVAWGDLEEIAHRVSEHRAAGADHVALHVLGADPSATGGLPRRQWRELAALLPTSVNS